MKVIVIEDCVDCPYFRCIDDDIYECRLLKQFIYNCEGIDSDCPLEDKDE